MVVRLRLARHGTRNNPFYHVVAIPDHLPRQARPLEKLGEYDPVPRPKTFQVPKLDPEVAVGSSGIHVSGWKGQPVVAEPGEKRLEWNEGRIKYWLSEGAQPSKPVVELLMRANLIPEGKWYKGMPRSAEENEAARVAGMAMKVRRSRQLQEEQRIAKEYKDLQRLRRRQARGEDVGLGQEAKKEGEEEEDSLF